jgi:hypothetical protein
MADLYVKNNLNPHKSVRFCVNIQKFVDKENDGEAKYYLEIGTTHEGIYTEGDNATYSGVDYVKIRPGYLDKIQNATIDEEFSKILGKLSAYIDWSPLMTDTTAPYMAHMEPLGEDVSIYANVRFTITDDIPTTGIDLTDMQIILDNGVQEFDITNECTIQGNPFTYEFTWRPPIRVLNG